MDFIDLHNIFKDNLVISSIPNYFNNSETPIICYKYNKPIRSTLFNSNPFTAVYKCTQYAKENYGYFDFIMVLHIISYKIITIVGIYTKLFPACLRHLVQCLTLCFLVIACQICFQQLKIHECLLSFTASLFWNGRKKMVQKGENGKFSSFTIADSN